MRAQPSVGGISEIGRGRPFAYHLLSSLLLLREAAAGVVQAARGHVAREHAVAQVVAQALLDAAAAYIIINNGQGDLCRFLDHKVGHSLPFGERLDVLECMRQQFRRHRVFLGACIGEQTRLLTVRYVWVQVEVEFHSHLESDGREGRRNRRS